jgi:FKBP-type peptidyl-prolyl cis-trans isomerase
MLALTVCLTAGCSDRRIELAETPDYVIEDVRVGAGPVADYGDQVVTRYVLSLPDGRTVVEVTGRKSHTWTLGDGTVVAGVDEAVIGMRPGGVRRVVIPPDLHYGEDGYGNGAVPPNTDLHLKIWLDSIR